jgi:peroxiredoxin
MTRMALYLLCGACTMSSLILAASADPKDNPPTPTVQSPARLQVGATAPDFTLTDTQGKAYKLNQFADKVVVLEWFNPDCPFVKKHHQMTHNMIDTQAFAAKQGVVWLAINSAGPGKQGYGLERNKKAIEEYKMGYPVLLDETGAVGKLYGAKTTPDMFVIANGKIVYAGAIDDRPDTEALGKINYVRAALMQLSAGKTVDPAETKPYGCSVKYAS